MNQCWLVYWRIYASLGLNELLKQNRDKRKLCPRKIYEYSSFNIERWNTCNMEFNVDPGVIGYDGSNVPPFELFLWRRIFRGNARNSMEFWASVPLNSSSSMELHGMSLNFSCDLQEFYWIQWKSHRIFWWVSLNSIEFRVTLKYWYWYISWLGCDTLISYAHNYMLIYM